MCNCRGTIIPLIIAKVVKGRPAVVKSAIMACGDLLLVYPSDSISTFVDQMVRCWPVWYCYIFLMILIITFLTPKLQTARSIHLFSRLLVCIGLSHKKLSWFLRLWPEGFMFLITFCCPKSYRCFMREVRLFVRRPISFWPCVCPSVSL